MGIRSFFLFVFVALVVSSGCGTSTTAVPGKGDASRDVADAGDDDTGGNVPDTSFDWRLEVDCPDCNGICGDGVLRPGEQCDDGNRTAGDGCSLICQINLGWTCPVPGLPCERLPPDQDSGPDGT